MTDAEPSSPAEADTSSVSRGELIYATTLIAFASGFNYLDRSGPAILIEPIKHEFALTDTEAGLLTGFAFSVTYACFAIPLARLADTRNRVHLLSACIAVSSPRCGNRCGAAFRTLPSHTTRTSAGSRQCGKPCAPPPCATC